MQRALVMSEEPLPEIRHTRSFSAASADTASPTAEFSPPRSVIACTPPVSNHSRAIRRPTSGSILWSPTTMSTGRPATLPPASRTAWFTA